MFISDISGMPSTFDLGYPEVRLIDLPTNSGFINDACNLLESRNFSEFVDMIKRHRSSFKSNIYEVLMVAAKKLRIFNLISDRNFSTALTEVKILKENLKCIGVDFRHFATELSRILKKSHFYMLDFYQSSISQVIEMLKHILQYEDLYLVNYQSIICFEQWLLIGVYSNELDLAKNQVDSAQNQSTGSLVCTHATSKFEKSYCKQTGLKNKKFISIKRENVSRSIIRLFLIAIDSNSIYRLTAKKLNIKTASYRIQGITYKSCNNSYLTHLFSFQEVFELYHQIMVLSSEERFNQLKKSICIREGSDQEILKWYIVNLHFLFGSKY